MSSVVCAACRHELAVFDEAIVCGGCGQAYERLDGVPVLMADADLEAVDLRATGGALPTYDCAHMGIACVDDALARGDAVLELGAGLDVHEAPNLVKTDAFVFDGARLDLVADAHVLPFPDASFDFVFSLAVFEHLHSPWIAAREIARVLRPGGQVYTLAAFLQPLHGYPDHYFNTTESGLARLFADDFEVLAAGPSRHCPHRQSLVPLDRMREMCAIDKRGLPWRSRVRAWRLDRALRRASHEYLQLADTMSHDPQGFAAWRQIAPAVEVHAVRTSPA
jgi:SAM-dependent methyltransferase